MTGELQLNNGELVSLKVFDVQGSIERDSSSLTGSFFSNPIGKIKVREASYGNIKKNVENFLAYIQNASLQGNKTTEANGTGTNVLMNQNVGFVVFPGHFYCSKESDSKPLKIKQSAKQQMLNNFQRFQEELPSSMFRVITSQPEREGENPSETFGNNLVAQAEPSIENSVPEMNSFAGDTSMTVDTPSMEDTSTIAMNNGTVVSPAVESMSPEMQEIVSEAEEIRNLSAEISDNYKVVEQNRTETASREESIAQITATNNALLKDNSDLQEKIKRVREELDMIRSTILPESTKSRQARMQSDETVKTAIERENAANAQLQDTQSKNQYLNDTYRTMTIEKQTMQEKLRNFPQGSAIDFDALFANAENEEYDISRGRGRAA